MTAGVNQHTEALWNVTTGLYRALRAKTRDKVAAYAGVSGHRGLRGKPFGTSWADPGG